MDRVSVAFQPTEHGVFHRPTLLQPGGTHAPFPRANTGGLDHLAEAVGRSHDLASAHDHPSVSGGIPKPGGCEVKLVLALALAGAGVMFGLLFDLFGHRKRPPAPTSAVPTEQPDALVSRTEQPDASGSSSALATQQPDTPAYPEPRDERPAPRLRVRDVGVSLHRPSWCLSAPLVGGMDRCRHGWVLVVTSVDEGGGSVVSVVSDLKEALALLDAGQLSAVAVDVPIGLPESGPRTCDVAARRLLGPRRSSVFPAPPRCTLGSATYQEACSWSRAACGKAVSRQTFAIMAKVEALDHLMTPERQDSLIEVHPEVSFTALAGEPMVHHKATEAGKAERITALRSAFSDIAEHTHTWLPGSRPTDILDAFVAAWSARRWVMGSYQRLGGDVDERGLRMEIIA